MKFYPNEAPDHYKGERLCWNYLKHALDGDDGVTYYRYPVFTGRGSKRREPDFLILSRKYGIWVLECKGAKLGNIVEIQGQEWLMRQWYDERIAPVQQAEDQMWEVKALVERNRATRNLKLVFDYRVILPFIDGNEWHAAGFASHPNTQGVVLTKDQLERSALRTELRTHGLAHMPELSDEQWEEVKAVFRGSVSADEPRAVADDTPPYSPLRTIRGLQSRLRQLDDTQERVSQETPEGPQRIRGLAGTGKTVLFAKRAARILAAHPEWDVGFVFYTRSLYQQIRSLIARTYEDLTTESLDPTRINIWHAWGGKDLTGLYREASLRWDQRPLNLNDAKRALGSHRANSEGFTWVCEQLESAIEEQEVEPFLDALLIDEGQDLPPAFYRLALRALRPPQRLYWAYDEAQGIGNLIVPTAAEVFGTSDDGTPKVDLSGSYPSGIQKAHNLNRCYRTPAAILQAAHAFNMGLVRVDGPLQGVTTQHEWSLLGYNVDGDFSQAAVAAGSPVRLTRSKEASGHPYDDEAFSGALKPESCFEVCSVDGKPALLSALTSAISRDLELGLEPSDVMVVSLPSCGVSMREIVDALAGAGIDAFEAGSDKERAVFRDESKVTVSSIYRAKGNESWKVYALGLHVADPARCKDPDDELVRRNQVFTALTRARGWCVAMGFDGTAMSELDALAKTRVIEFRAFNKRSLRRELDPEGTEQADLFSRS